MTHHTPVAKMTSPMVAVVALITLTLSLLAAIMPNFVRAGHISQPPLSLLIAAGLVVIVGMSVVLLIATKLGLNLSRATLFAVLAFNVALIIVKFVLAPLGLYYTNAVSPFSEQTFLVGINNDPTGFWFAAIGSIVAYLLALWVIFRITSHGLSLDETKKHRKVQPWMLFAAGLVVVAIVSGQLVLPLSVALLPVSGLADYLSKLSVMLPLIAVFLLVAIAFAISAFKSAAADAKAVGHSTMLAGLFWLCLCLILMYHVLWVVFMTALVTIWPFKTFIPNSK